ncbi:hypothetical protein [Cribrihabitans neustonicus]|uniref:hypothetical protein n=1 Tax=Cribrihabitans neustonicus TaxID=1429085 RepID=UPI003B5CC365
MNRRYLTAAAISTCAAVAAPAGAETTWDQPGKGMGISSSTVTEIAESHMVMQIRSDYESVEMGDESHPMQGAAGPCFGAVEIASGAADGNGICAFTDNAGDTVVLHWTAKAMDETGALTGDWEVSGGTGKWQEAKGGGEFSSLTDPESGQFVNTFTSNVTVP